MKDSLKNTITNIIGLVILGINVYMFYWGEEELFSFLAVLVVSLALFMFKASKTKEWLDKALSKIISK